MHDQQVLEVRSRNACIVDLKAHPCGDVAHKVQVLYAMHVVSSGSMERFLPAAAAAIAVMTRDLLQRPRYQHLQLLLENAEAVTRNEKSQWAQRDEQRPQQQQQQQQQQRQG